jgi:hypothetical protein
MLNNRACGRELGQIEAAGSQLIVVAGVQLFASRGWTSLSKDAFAPWELGTLLAGLGGLAEFAAKVRCLQTRLRLRLGSFNASTLSTNYFDNSYTTKCVEVLLENAVSLDLSCAPGLRA